MGEFEYFDIVALAEGGDALEFAGWVVVEEPVVLAGPVGAVEGGVDCL